MLGSRRQPRRDNGRVPFAPSHEGNNTSTRTTAAAGSAGQKPRVREVTSRYRNASTARSPSPARSTASSVDSVDSIRRASSIERRRSVSMERKASATNGLWPSANCVDSQKKKRESGAADFLNKNSTSRRRSSIRSEEQTENEKPRENILAKPSFQHGKESSGNAKMVGMSMSRSVNLSSSRERTKQAPRSAHSATSMKSLSQSVNGSLASPQYEVQRDLSNSDKKESRVKANAQRKLLSSSNGQAEELNGRASQSRDEAGTHATPTALILSEDNSLKVETRSTDADTNSTGASLASPANRTPRPSSPSKLLSPSKVSSPSRGLPSPPRPRPSSSLSCRSTSPLHFATESFKGKKAAIEHEEAHLLRVLHNRLLQWRFVNARAESAMNVQNKTAERLMFNAWMNIFNLRTSVAIHQIKLQAGKQATKLAAILRAHGPGLQEWSRLANEHWTALSELLGALDAAVLRVPLCGGAKGDAEGIHEAMQHASYVMGSLDAAVQSLLPKGEAVSTIADEVTSVMREEEALLKECGDLLANVASLEIEERSLQLHFMQLQCEQARTAAYKF